MMKLSNKDFGLDSEEEGEGEKKEDKKSINNKKELLKKLDKELDELDLDKEDVSVEKIEKKELNLTNEEKLNILKKESPILLELLKEFKDMLVW